MDPAVAILESGKLILQAYFNFMRQAGKTEEEIELIYQSEKAQFDLNRPEDLE